MPAEPDVRYVVPADISEEDVAEARKALEDLARALGRISARVWHEMGIRFDMDDPEVAREVLTMTFEAMFLTAPKTVRRVTKARKSKDS
jgi:NAD(P)-dependent dehydrogenase (short-subunit alcohol dehydrogenase family)